MTHTRPVCTNLSYVLHEPSTSSQIDEYARRIEARRPRIAKLVSYLGSLGEEGLRGRIVMDPRKSAMFEELGKNDQPAEVLSLRLGAWKLLSQLLQAVTGSLPSVTFFDTPSDTLASDGTIWFGGRSLIGQPAARTGSRPAFLVLAIVRPGDQAILLDIERVTPQAPASGVSLSDPPRWPAQALRVAENAVRSYLDQWGCEQPLWGAPAEAALPEFQGE